MTSSNDKHNLDGESRENPMVDACKQSHEDHNVKRHLGHPVDEWARI